MKVADRCTFIRMFWRKDCRMRQRSTCRHVPAVPSRPCGRDMKLLSRIKEAYDAKVAKYASFSAAEFTVFPFVCSAFGSVFPPCLKSLMSACGHSLSSKKSFLRCLRRFVSCAVVRCVEHEFCLYKARFPFDGDLVCASESLSVLSQSFNVHPPSQQA